MNLLQQLLDDAWRLLRLKQRPPLEYGYDVRTLSLVLLALGAITAEPGAHFVAPLMVRLGYYAVQYLLTAYLFAWVLSNTLGRRGYALPFQTAYALITLLSLPDLAVPLLRYIDPGLMALYSLVVFGYTLFVLFRTLEDALRAPAPDRATCIALAVLAMLLLSHAFAVAGIATGLIDPNAEPVR